MKSKILGILFVSTMVLSACGTTTKSADSTEEQATSTTTSEVAVTDVDDAVFKKFKRCVMN